MTDFKKQVYKTIKKIPKGKVSTYKQIAISIGKPKSSRAVGNALNKNPNAPEVPCHRVVKSDGSLGGYVKGEENKKSLLKKEGIEFKENKINLNKFLFLN